MISTEVPMLRATSITNATPQCIHRIEVPQAVDGILLAKRAPFDPASLSAALSWSISVVIVDPSDIANSRPPESSARRFVKSLSNRLTATDLPLPISSS
jgi:hypothetical protein